MSLPATYKSIQLSTDVNLCTCPKGTVEDLCPLIDTTTKRVTFSCKSSISQQLRLHMKALPPRDFITLDFKQPIKAALLSDPTKLKLVINRVLTSDEYDILEDDTRLKSLYLFYPISIEQVKRLCAKKRRGFLLECRLLNEGVTEQQVVNLYQSEELRDKVVQLEDSRLSGYDVLRALKSKR